MPQTTDFIHTDGIIAECTPFFRHCLCESEVKALRRQTREKQRCYGHFVGSPLQQILYYFEENLIDGAILSHISDRDLHRLAETVQKPLFLEETIATETAAERRERQPATGLCLPHTTHRKLLRAQKKPYILRFPADFETYPNITEDLKDTIPFGLWCENPRFAREAKRWIENIFNEMR